MPPPQVGWRLVELRPAVQSARIGRSRRPVDELVDELEQRGVRPVEVLEQQDERARRGYRLEESLPGCEGLLALGLAAPPARPTSGPRRSSSHSASSISATAARRACARSSSGRSDSRMPAWAFTTSPSAQNVMPSPYGRQRPCRHEDDLGPVVDPVAELGEEPRLADAGLARQGDELDLRLAEHALVRARGAAGARALGRRTAPPRACPCRRRSGCALRSRATGTTDAGLPFTVDGRQLLVDDRSAASRGPSAR